MASWRQLLAQLDQLDVEGVEAFSAATARLASRAAGRAQAQAGRQYAKWVATTWKTAQGLVHRQIKGEGPVPLETVQPGAIVANPRHQMMLRADRWDAVWSSPTFDESKLQSWLERTASRAREEELDPHDVPGVRRALQAISAKKAMGVDALRSSDVSRLPDEANLGARGHAEPD